MTIAERHKYILDELNRAGFVSVSDLAKNMEVTMVTIRKDLKLLEDKGLLYRSHGSATPASPYVSDR
ncbi:DeoR family transcriptional regulator, partial [Algoriphagus sp.]